MITNQHNRTNVQQFHHYGKVTLIHLLIAIAIGGALWGATQAKARSMEREMYKQNLESLKGQ